ncbi:CBS domain-containing protein [Patescibacteria group bacterium]|nr:CBS domain-containing protein [Patescibacteria group bacterium]MBU1721426.1 CBS domain-containing protein [Patescibacteria group bacterium]MBU1901581.1 CBS domain-containing protein [Patescibacteria group bacterium]
MRNALISHIQDYMQTDIKTVYPENTVSEVIAFMIKEKTNGVVVINRDNTVAGIISSWDIIKHIVPDYLEENGNLAMFEAEDVFKIRTKEVASDPISILMTTQVKTAKKEDTLIEALTLLARFHIRQLPIVDEHNHLVGYINRTDIKLAVGDVLNKI